MYLFSPFFPFPFYPAPGRKNEAKDIIGRENIAGGVAGLYANDQRYLAYAPEINFLLSDRLGLSASLEGAVFAENEPAAPAFSVGIFLKAVLNKNPLHSTDLAFILSPLESLAFLR